jgi:hypothetical protein
MILTNYSTAQNKQTSHKHKLQKHSPKHTNSIQTKETKSAFNSTYIMNTTFTFTLLVMALALLATFSVAHKQPTPAGEYSAAATTKEIHNTTEKIENNKFLVRNLRHLQPDEGACNNICSADSDCDGFVGGPNPCHYCNQGNCSEDAAPPTPAPTMAPTSSCDTSKTCTEDSDCDPDNSCVCYMGHYGQGPHCGEYTG